MEVSEEPCGKRWLFLFLNQSNFRFVLMLDIFPPLLPSFLFSMWNIPFLTPCYSDRNSKHAALSLIAEVLHFIELSKSIRDRM